MRTLLVGAALLVAACGGSNKKATQTGGSTTSLGTSEATELPVPKVDATLCETGDKQVSAYDLDRDGKPDVWKIYKTTTENGATLQVLTCKQVDFDHDGKKDYVVTYDDGGAKITEEMDFDYDGRFDARYYYDKKTGRVYVVERASGFAAKPNMWEEYDGAGEVKDIKRDRNADGRPDYWEQYEGGKLQTILFDDDFDGKVDRQEKSAAAAAAAKPAPAQPAATQPAPAPAPGEKAPG